MRASQRSKNAWMSAGPSRSQIACRRAGSWQVANPLASSVNPIPAAWAWRLGPLVAVDPHLGRIGEVTAQLDKPGAEVTVQHVEVIDRHPPVGLGEGEAGWAGLAGGAVIAGKHALEL